MTTPARIGLGVIGAGIAAWTGHLPVVAEGSQTQGSQTQGSQTQGSDFALLALHDRDAGQLERAVARFAVPRHSVAACSSLDDFFAVPGLQAAVIATPTASHYEIAMEAIRRRMHVLVEKPLASTAAECEDLIARAAQQRVVLAVGHEKRFHPTFLRVRELLVGGAIGQPYFCGVHWASAAKLDPPALVPPGFEQGYKWRWEDATAGGGILQDHLPHYADLLRYWTGAEPAAVYAQTLNVARDLLHWPPSSSVWEDFAVAVVRFSSGLLLRFETGTVGRSLSPIWSLGSGLGEWTEYLYILGSAGQLLCDMLPWDSSEHGRIALWRCERVTREGLGWSYVEQPEPIRRHGSPSGAAAAMFAAQLREWGRAIRGEPSQIAVGQDGAIALMLVEAAYRAAASGCECSVVKAE